MVSDCRQHLTTDLLILTEFESHINQMLFVSATPNVYEKEHELARVEQIIRPTGLLDPEITSKTSQRSD